MGQDHTQEFLHELKGIKKMVEQLEQKNQLDMQMLDIYKSAEKPQNMDDTSKKLLDSQTKISQLTEDNQRLQDRIDYLNRAVEHLTNVNNANTDQNKKLELENSYLKKQVLDLQSKTHGVQTLHEVKPEDNEAGTSMRAEETNMIPAARHTPETMMRAVHHAPETIMAAATTENTLVPSDPVQPEQHRESMVMRGVHYIAGGLGFGGSSPAKASGSTNADQYLVKKADNIALKPEDKDVLAMTASDLNDYAESKKIQVSGTISMGDRLKRVLHAMTDEELKTYKTKYKISESLDRKKSFEEMGKITMLSDLLKSVTDPEWKTFFQPQLKAEKVKDKITSALSTLTPTERNDLRQKVFPLKLTEKRNFCKTCETYGITSENKTGLTVEDLYHYAMENTETVAQYV